MSPILLFAVLSVYFFGVSDEKSPRPDLCGTLELSCKCGKNSTPRLWKIPLCPSEENPLKGYFLHGEFPNAADYCSRFLNCKQCYRNGQLMCKSCPPQKFGRFCDESCGCKNGGTCTREGNCLCRKEYGGSKCERKTSDYDCMNGGICTGGHCLCGKEYSGPKCERKNCDCKNGGTCTKKENCLCPVGYEGPKCESIRCGRPYPGKTPFIQYGTVTKVGQWPWQVALFIYSKDKKKWDLLCSGTLLNDLWVMTAAHCFLDSNSLIRRKEQFRLFLGKYYRELPKDDNYVQKAKIAEFHIHPQYDNCTDDADIALIKLKKPVKKNMRVQPVCLPSLQTSERNIVQGKKGVVTGWGYNENNNLNEILEQAEIPVVTGKYCQKGYGAEGRTFDLTENMFCAGYSEDVAPDSAAGDSGGPMIFLDSFSNEPRWVVEGIVSRENPVFTENGEFFQLGIYTKVWKFLSWIKSYIEEPRISVSKG